MQVPPFFPRGISLNAWSQHPPASDIIGILLPRAPKRLCSIRVQARFRFHQENCVRGFVLSENPSFPTPVFIVPDSPMVHARRPMTGER